MKQRGYTLLELLLTISLTGAVAIVVGASYAQIMKARVDITQKSQALADIDNASHWLTRDLVLAQTTSLIDGAGPTYNMTIDWLDRTAWAADSGNITHSVTYTRSGKQLIRTYDGQATTIANYITTANFSVDTQVFTITLVSRPGLPDSEVRKTFIIEERSDLP